MATGLAKTTKTETALVSAIDNCHLAAEMKNTAVKSLKLAHGVVQLREALNHPEVLSTIMGLQNTGVGFLTDRKGSGYDSDIVVNAVIEGLSNGAMIHNNEMNIIGGRCYLAQSFFARKLREYCTSHGVKRHFSYTTKYLEPSGKQKKFSVTAKISWAYPAKDKQEHSETYELVGMTTDQVVGKAKKRAFAWLYNELSDNNYPVAPDEDTFDMVEEPVKEEPEKPKFSIEDCEKALLAKKTKKELEAAWKFVQDNTEFGSSNELHALYTELLEGME